jgi:hypothetical protein
VKLASDFDETMSVNTRPPSADGFDAPEQVRGILAA